MLHEYELNFATNDIETMLDVLMLSIVKVYGDGRNEEPYYNTISIFGHKDDKLKNRKTKRYIRERHFFHSKEEKRHPNDEVLLTVLQYSSNIVDESKDDVKMTIDKKATRRNKGVIVWTESSLQRLRTKIKRRLEALAYLEDNLYDGLVGSDEPENYFYNDEDIDLRKGYQIIIENETISILQTITSIGK